ncbi:MAG: glycine/sarcosine/betaine reductase component B subunit, partial [Thermovirgaceae bacterium]
MAQPVVKKTQAKKYSGEVLAGSALKLRSVPVDDVMFGETTEIRERTLFVNREEIMEALLEDRHIHSVDIR